MNTLPCLALAAALACALPSLRAQRMELADSSAAAVTVESADIRCEVTGRIAVTTLDLVFRNPNHRVLEGTFALPLLDGQSVTRFALDIGGVLREAVPVDKVKGRVVFEEIQRRRVDPGLLEQTAGNNYRARVFPIPAGGTRRIVVAYQEDIARGGVTTAIYRLNLDFPQPLKNFRLAVSALAGGTPGKVHTTLGLELPAWREGRHLEIARTDFRARGMLELALPALDRPGAITGRHGAEEFFYAEAPAAAVTRPRPAPRTVGLLWDSSGSGADRDQAREFALLDAWFARLRDVEVRLIRLRDQAETPGNFTVRGGDWRTLRTALEKTIYDGATALDGLADDSAVDEWLLFSDGLINYGVTPAGAKLPLRGVVHAVLASPRADAGWLRSVAARHGGEFANLLALDAAVAVERLRTQSARVLRVESDPREVAEVFPEKGAVVASGPLVVTGRLRHERAVVRLHVGTSDADAKVVEIAIRSGENASPLAARGWAAEKIAHLSLDPAGNRADIRRTTREFGLVSADTSLIVLETVDDYARYDIEPPAELRRDWLARRRRTADERTKTRDDHLAGILRAFEERVAWWERKFPKDTPPPPKTVTAQSGSNSANVLDRFGGAGNSSPTAREPQPARPAPAEEGVIQLQAFTVASHHTGGGFAAASSSRQRGPGAPAPVRNEDFAESPAPVITLQRWSPHTGYLDRLKRATPEAAPAVYLEERVAHARQPGFFLDVAGFFFDRGDTALALQILSNLAELELEDAALLRVLAHRLTQAERADLALPLFERVLALRPDEPQSRRDLALACADLGQRQRAIDLLWEVVERPWDLRFADIGLIALGELNALAATGANAPDLSRVDPRLRKNLPVQTRVILTWDANDCDIDLWVTDPNAETANYGHTLTHQGGRMSRDFTAGYGPEEFLLRAPKPGTYRVKINYYGDNRQSALGPVTAQVRLITGFGTAAQQEQRLTVRLDDRKQSLEVGTFEVAVPLKKSPATEARRSD